MKEVYQNRSVREHHEARKRTVCALVFVLGLAISMVRAQTLGEALNAAHLTWTTGGSAPWSVHTLTNHDGVASARSGVIGHSQESWLETTVTGPGPLSFWWIVSSQTSGDYLEFYTNGVGLAATSGLTKWQEQAFMLGEGVQVLRWRYVKDRFASSWQDAGWVDQVTFVNPSGPPSILASTSHQTNQAGTRALFSVYAGGAPPLSCQWLKDGVPLANGGSIAGATSLSLTVSNALFGDNGNYSVVVTNLLGSVTSAVTVFTVVEPGITNQPVRAKCVPGQTAALSVGSGGTPPLFYQWRKDGQDIPEAVASSITMDNLQGANAGFYTVVVSNVYGCVTSKPAEISVNLAALDTRFNPAAGRSIYAMAFLHEGKILLGGSFTSMGGQTRNYIARIYDDGSLDIHYNPNANGYVYTMAVQLDGKVLIGGTFTQVAGQARYRIARLNQDGSLDSSFAPAASNAVLCLLVQPNRKIMVGGAFTNLSGQPRSYLARLNPDGSSDEGFNLGVSASVNSMAMQADGKILLGGTFTNVGGQKHFGVARLHSDGSLDETFNPQASIVSTLAVQSDGRILLGGLMGTLNGLFMSGVGRLHADGATDTSFANPNVGLIAYPYYMSLGLQADGRILVGGNYFGMAGQSRNGLGRLNADSTLDSTFDLGVDGLVNGVGMKADGEILVGGLYTTMGGQTNPYISKLLPTEPVTQSLTVHGSTVTWRQNSSCPAFSRVTMDYSTNGLDWIALGPVQYGPEGWQATDSSLPGNVAIRARGFATGGYNNASSWFVEKYAGATVAHASPPTPTHNAGSTAIFSAQVVGSTPMLFQWYKDGAPLVDGNQITGATTATLTVGSVFKANEGRYSLTIFDGQYTSTNHLARLAVRDPAMVLPGTNLFFSLGENCAVDSGAQGSMPMNCYWWKEGHYLGVTTNGSLLINGFQPADRGSYQIVASNQFGMATSSVIQLHMAPSLDPGFSQSVAALNADVAAMACQNDGKLVVGGWFTNIAGQTRLRLARLNPDGSLEEGFAASANGVVYALALQTDGKIVVGGAFTQINNQPRAGLARLLANGTLEASFNPGADNTVNTLALQADGKIVVGGWFTQLGGQSRPYLGRLLSTGDLDANYNPGPSYYIQALSLQPDGKLLLGGWFTTVGGVIRKYIARLNPDGSLDSAYNPGAGGYVYAFATQADGKMLVGGSFTNLAGQTCNRLGRLNPDGSLDHAFATGASATVYSMAVQADGKILVAGIFTNLAGQTRNRIARLHQDATLDPTFDPNANSGILAITLLPGGDILAGGGFTVLAGQACGRLARIFNSEMAQVQTACDPAGALWNRSATSPEFWRTTGEMTTNGNDWTPLGNGQRIPGGWQWTGQDIPQHAVVRLRGYVTGGYNNASSWFVETTLTNNTPPRLAFVAIPGSLGVASNRFLFRVRGEVGRSIVFESSTNLQQWAPFQTNALEQESTTFSDPSSLLDPRRFYRSRFAP